MSRALMWRRRMVALSGLLMIALLLRAPRLAESLWYDEIAAWRDYGMLGATAAMTTYHDPANHIVHTLLTAYSVPYLSDALGQELALRFPALLFSLGAILATWGMVKRLDQPRVAIIAAAMAAITPVAVLEGTEARGYSMMIFFTIAATWQMTAALDTRKWWRWLLYAILCALGSWSHIMTVFVPVGHALWLAWRATRCREWNSARWGAFGIALAALLTIALYWPVLGDILRVSREFGGRSIGAPSPVGVEGLHTLLQLGGSWYWWAALPGLILAVIGFAASWPDAARRRLIALLMLGLPVMVLALLTARSWMYARFALFAMPGAWVLIAFGLDALWRRRRSLALAGLGALIAAFAIELTTRPVKQPLRDAAHFIADPDQRGEDGVLIVGLRHQVMDAYAGRLNPIYSLFHGADLPAILDAQQPRWVIVMYPRSVSADRYAALEQRGYGLIRRFEGWVDWTNGDVLVYRR